MISPVKSQRKREVWLDYARVCAILCVILCHAVETYYRPALIGDKQIAFIPWLVETLLFTIGRLGVPLFLAISGTLLLSKEKDIFAFYKRSVLPLLLTTEIWIIFNYFFAGYVYNREYSVIYFLEQIFFMDSPSLSHTWYMPMIIGVYLFVPFLAKLLREYDSIKYYAIPLVLVGIGSILVPTLNMFINEDLLSDMNRLSFKVDLAFGGGVYGLYFVLGYFIGRKGLLKKIRTRWLIIVSLLLLAGNTAWQYYLYSHGYYDLDDLLWYTSVAVFAAGLSLFEIIRRLKKCLENWNFSGVALMAKCSFGIYLLHKPIMILCERWIVPDNINLMFKIIMLFCLSLLFSILILIPFVLKWRKAGRILFYIKG